MGPVLQLVNRVADAVVDEFPGQTGHHTGLPVEPETAENARVRAQMSPSAYAASSAASPTPLPTAMTRPMYASAKISAAGPPSAIIFGFGTTPRTSATTICRTLHFGR